MKESNIMLTKFMGWKSSGTEVAFHTSWDYLMKAVERIYHTGISGGVVHGLREALMTGDIDRVYEEVVEFVKWQQK